MKLLSKCFQVLAGIAAAILPMGCDRSENIKTIYGPPEMMGHGNAQPAPAQPAAQDVTPDDYEIDNPPGDVYGPPEWFEGGRDAEEEVVAVYGPPEWFEEPNQGADDGADFQQLRDNERGKEMPATKYGMPSTFVPPADDDANSQQQRDNERTGVFIIPEDANFDHLRKENSDFQQLRDNELSNVFTVPEYGPQPAPVTTKYGPRPAPPSNSSKDDQKSEGQAQPLPKVPRDPEMKPLYGIPSTYGVPESRR